MAQKVLYVFYLTYLLEFFRYHILVIRVQLRAVGITYSTKLTTRYSLVDTQFWVILLL